MENEDVKINVMTRESDKGKCLGGKTWFSVSVYVEVSYDGINVKRNSKFDSRFRNDYNDHEADEVELALCDLVKEFAKLRNELLSEVCTTGH